MNAEDLNRRKIIVTILTAGSALLLLGLMITHLISFFSSTIPTRVGTSLFVIPTLLAGHVLMYMLIRRKKILLVSFTLTVIYGVGSIYGAYIWGISMPFTLLIFSLVVNLIGLLFSSRAAVITTICTFIAIAFLGIREINNPDITQWKKYGIEMIDIASYIVIISVGSALTVFSNREMEKSLRRARNSEKDLEIKIELRTRELRRSQAETISAMSQTYELGKVAQGLFHDLISPLSSAVMLISEYDRTKSRVYIDKAISASQRMQRMLDVTKHQLQTKKDTETFDVLPEIETARDLLLYQARNAGARIEISASANQLLLSGIPTQFCQIILNILQNAIESFTIEKNPLVHIEIIGSKIIISNNGPEIPSHILNKLFTECITTKANHNGIGLPAIKNIIEKFEGMTNVKTSPTQTIFTIHFPKGKIYPLTRDKPI